MAEQLILVRGNDFVSDVDHLHLLDDTDGITLERGGWTPSVEEAGLVTEPFTLTVKGTTHDTLATKLHGLDTKLQQIKDYIRATPEKYCVFLRDQATGETGARQSLVTGSSIRLGGSYHQPNYLMEKYLLGLDRVAPWESVVNSPVSLVSNSAYGGNRAFSEACGSMDMLGLDLLYTLAHTPAEGTLVVLHYTDGTAKLATGTLSAGGATLTNSGNTIAVITTSTSLRVWGEAAHGGTTADIGTAVTIDYGWSNSFTISGGILSNRIGMLGLYGISGGGTINEIWIGFRTARFGTLANFVTVWEVEAGTAGTETVATTDATATPVSGNTKLQCQYTAHADDHIRFTLTAYQISAANYADQRGTFDIIARVKVGSGVTAVLHLDNGYLDGSTFTASEQNQKVTVTSTTWKYVNLGRITWPPLGRVTSNLNAMKNACLALYAERTAGSEANWLDVDHFIPVPVDEGFAHFSSMAVAYNGDNAQERAEVYCNPLGDFIGIQCKSSVTASLISTQGATVEQWHMPIGSSVIVIAAQTNSPAITDQIQLDFYIFKRYPTMRGTA